MPKTWNSSVRSIRSRMAHKSAVGEANTAHTLSPVCLNRKPLCASIAVRNTLSWTASAACIACASVSHRRVEPSTSVNKNVTTPEGAAAGGAGTPAESHNRHTPTSHIGGIRPRRHSARSVGVAYRAGSAVSAAIVMVACAGVICPL